MRTTNNTVKRMKDTIADYDRKIDTARARAQRNTQADQQPILDRIHDIEEEVSKSGHEQLKCRASWEDADEARRVHADKLTTLRDHINLATEAETKIRHKIKGLESAKQDSAVSFGETMPNILRAIQNETGWQRRPVGPIGRHVKLTNEHRGYSGVLESFFSDTLNSFLVDNERDKQLLSRIVRQNRPK